MRDEDEKRRSRGNDEVDMMVDGAISSLPKVMQYPKRILTPPEKKEAEYRYIDLGQSFTEIADYFKTDLVVIFRLSRKRNWDKRQAKRIEALVRGTLKRPRKKLEETLGLAINAIHQKIAQVSKRSEEMTMTELKMLSSVIKDLAQIAGGSGATLQLDDVRATDLPANRLEAVKEDIIEGLRADPMTDVDALLKRAGGDRTQ